ncbi:MAG: GvpL/GvpF family gas vesicle protein [Gemmatimonadales bacterium]|jgi:hypothetical protein
MAEQEQSLSPPDAEETRDVESAESEGMLLRGVMRFRGHDRRLAKLTPGPDDELVEHRGLAALVHPVPYRLPEWNRDHLREHSSAVERAMRRTTIVPAPYGIVFRGREQVVEFLTDQHVALEEVLTFFDGTFEMRLHIQPSGARPDISESVQADRAASFYTALRRRSRAAFTLTPTGKRLLSGAFLVSRTDWVHFVEYADQLDADHPEFLFDLTGPWPPYDFVKMAFYTKDDSGE